jgi:hypothetical protein
VNKNIAPLALALNPPAELPAELDASKGSDDWLPDLGLAYKSAGDALFRAGRFEDALEKYQASLRIFERLARAEPHDSLAATLVHELKEKSNLATKQAFRNSPDERNPYSALLCFATLLITVLAIKFEPAIHGYLAQN